MVGMRFLIALLALTGIFDSALALRIHYQDPAAAPPCAVTEKFDCGAVNHGRFADFPPESFDELPGSKKTHIPVAIFGIVGYALIAVLVLFKRYWLTLHAAEIGFAFAAFLTYLEAYVIEKWCIYCLYSLAIITAILLATLVTLGLEYRRRRTVVVVAP
jgi:vitamin-K-epoxide reductase (warfarin-sensitive)